MVCAVSFTRYGQLHYLDPGELRPEVGDKVLVPTEDGPEVAEVMWAPQWTSEEIGALPTLAGMADERALEREATVRARNAEAKVAVRRLIREHDLPMKVIGIDHVPEADRTTIFFSAPHRVDFRSLLRDLGATLKLRVELRQIAERDQARVAGGLGSCGRDLCCATFLRQFEPVSVRMVKDQDLPLNPMRIAGACGRLMCCLKYEHPLYQDFAETAPAVGEQVNTAEGPGRVVGHSMPRDSVVVRMNDGGRTCVCSKASVCGSRQAYDANHEVPAG